MLLIAHRGLHAECAENTMAAFESAIRAGVDGIETDVRLSADGLPVIVHDRVTAGGRAVANLTRRELEAELGHAVPILPEVLDAFDGVLWNIEIKTPEAFPAAARVLRQFERTRRLLLTSFRHDIVKHAAATLNVDCGLLLAHRPLDVRAMLSTCKSESRIRTCVWDYNVIDDSILRAVAAEDWKNYIYGAVSEAEHSHCATLELAGIITDYPERGRREEGGGRREKP